MSIFTPRPVATSFGLLALLCAGRVAHAQGPMGGGGGMGGMGGMGGGGMQQGPGGGGKDKKEGPAEAAPKDKQALQPIEPVPAQPRGLRQLQLFELHGYMRMRADYFHRLDLGLSKGQNTTVGQTYGQANDLDQKFFPPPAVAGETIDGQGTNPPTPSDANCYGTLLQKGINVQKAGRRCGRHNGFGSANMRLRLEPTLHITDTVKVHATIDALDNLVLGSTPDAFMGDSPFAPIDLYTRTQNPPSAGLNNWSDSLVVKRAYGHIRFGWGLDIKFGRMPHHWGMGLVANDGNGYNRGERADIVRQLDMDYGDSVDSLRLGFDFGKDRRNVHTFEASWDWASSGPTTSQLLGQSWASGNRVGQDFSAEKFDNVYQWRLSILRRDDPAMLQRKLALGRPVVNYGAIAWIRSQAVDRVTGSPGLGDGLGTNPTWAENNADTGLGRQGNSLGSGDLDEEGDSGIQNYANLLIRRRALMVTPDIWLRVNWKTLRVELEASGTIGRMFERDLDRDVTETGFEYASIGKTGDLSKRTFMQLGYALEFKYGLFKDRFHLGLDHGFATGDPSGTQGYNPQSPLIVNGVDSRWTNFRFNPAYMQDLLLFRELLGTAANAAYFKPWMAFYFFDNNFSGRLDIEYAVAHQRAATWGNKANYGLEIDGAFRYHDQQEPIFVQIQYGVMFPFGAFNRTGSTYAGLPVENNGDAKAAQTVQAQIGIKF
nr:TIGR04551 family protein [Nannocystis sp.]